MEQAKRLMYTSGAMTLIPNNLSGSNNLSEHQKQSRSAHQWDTLLKEKRDAMLQEREKDIGKQKADEEQGLKNAGLLDSVSITISSWDTKNRLLGEGHIGGG